MLDINFQTLISLISPAVLIFVVTKLLDVGSLRESFKISLKDIDVLKVDSKELKYDVAVLKTDVAVLKADVNVLKSDVSILKTDVHILKLDVSNIKTDIALIKNHLLGTSGSSATLLASNSPIRLTAEGKKLLEECDFINIYNSNKTMFLDKIRAHNCSTPAEIDETSLSLMYSLKPDPLFANFKNIAYENGMVVELLLMVCAVYLREEAIKELLPNL